MPTRPSTLDMHRQHLRRGFNWLGTATVAAKIVDFATVLAMLHFLTKAQVGEAALVVSVGMVVEAFNGLGTSEALIQTPSTDRQQLDSLFWYIIAAAGVMSCVVLLIAPGIAGLYGLPGLAPYFWAIALKQPLVGAALIPLALMNRALLYRRIAVVNLCATLAAAITRLALGAAGAGAWALVLGYAASGLYTLIGALLARPFRPGWHLQLAAIRPLMQFGLRSASANIAEQMFKNIDFLLIGWFYGAAPLAIYRIAFDIAMEPAMAVATLVTRIALPVFARVAQAKAQLAEILIWSLRRIVILVAPLMTGLALAARPLMSLIHDRQGHTYAAAATPLAILSAAALLRVISQILPTVMLVSGRPGNAARLSFITFLLLTAGITAAGLAFPAPTGIIAASAIWLLIQPPVMLWGFAYLKRAWQVRAKDLAPAFVAPLAGSLALGLAVKLVHAFIRDARVEVGFVVVATGLTYAALFRRERLRA